MKIKLLAFAAVFAILPLFTPSAAFADATENPVIPAAEPVTVTSFRFYAEPYCPYYLELGGDVSGLALESEVYAMYSRFGGVVCTVAWRFDDFNASVVGSQALVGDVSLPDGYVYPSGEPTVESPVVVYDPADAPPETAQGGGLMYIEDRIVPLGMDAEALEQRIQDSVRYFSEAEFTTENGFLIGCGFSWDASLVDTGTVGAYHPFAVNLPPYLSLGGNEDMLLALYVLDPEEVDLRAFARDWNLMFIECRWICEIAKPELWVSVDGGEPEMDAKEDYGKFVGRESYTGLSIGETWLESGHVYDFEVRYEDGGRSVNTLSLDTTGKRPVCKLIGGDRNGYDRDTEEQPQQPESPNGGADDGADDGANGGEGDDEQGGADDDEQGDGQTDPVDDDSSSERQSEDPASSAEGTVRSGLPGDGGVPTPALASSVLQSVRQAVDGSHETKPLPKVPVPAAPASEPLRNGSTEPDALATPSVPPVLPFAFAGIAAAALLVRAGIRARKGGGSA
jgi:hypothetical protein